jgi:hypothetical protein
MGLKYEPLVDSGSLRGFTSFDVTPGLGTEFPDASLKEWLEAPNSDQLIRDLAITGAATIPFMAKGEESR